MYQIEGDVTLLRDVANGKSNIGLLMLSGANAGATGGEQLCVMEEYALTQRFARKGGVSTGACQLLFSASRRLHIARRYYSEECASPAFISKSPLRAFRGTTADVGFLVRNFRASEKRYDRRVLKQWPCPLDVFLTEYETGSGRVTDLRSHEDPVLPVHASAAIPVLYRIPIYISGVRYVDGGVAMPFPARQMFERGDLDGLIVITNCPKGWRPSRWRFLEQPMAALFHLPHALRDAMQARRGRFEEGLAFVRTQRHLIFWGDNNLAPYERRAKVLRAVRESAYAQTHELFSEVFGRADR